MTKIDQFIWHAWNERCQDWIIQLGLNGLLLNEIPNDVFSNLIAGLLAQLSCVMSIGWGLQRRMPPFWPALFAWALSLDAKERFSLFQPWPGRFILRHTLSYSSPLLLTIGQILYWPQDLPIVCLCTTG